MHPEAEGSVIQDFNADTSFIAVEQVDPSHFDARTFGRVVESEKAVAHEEDVGFVIQSFKGVTSELNETSALGIEAEVEYAHVQPTDDGFSMHAFSVLTSVGIEVGDA